MVTTGGLEVELPAGERDVLPGRKLLPVGIGSGSGTLIAFAALLLATLLLLVGVDVVSGLLPE